MEPRGFEFTGLIKYGRATKGHKNKDILTPEKYEGQNGNDSPSLEKDH